MYSLWKANKTNPGSATCWNCKPLSQSASHSTSQPATQPFRQPLSQSASHSASQSTTQPVSRPAYQPAIQSVVSLWMTKCLQSMKLSRKSQPIQLQCLQNVEPSPKSQHLNAYKMWNYFKNPNNSNQMSPMLGILTKIKTIPTHMSPKCETIAKNIKKQTSRRVLKISLGLNH